MTSFTQESRAQISQENAKYCDGSSREIESINLGFVPQGDIAMHSKHNMREILGVLTVLIATFFLTSELCSEIEHTEYLYSLDRNMYLDALAGGQEHSYRLIDDENGKKEKERLFRGLSCGQILVAEGDSWFNYPLKSDVIKRMRKMGWIIYSSARHGDTMESMLYDEGQLESLYRNLLLASVDFTPSYDHSPGECLVTSPYDSPKAILLSMGGNDIVGNALLFLLEHRRSSLYVEHNDINISQDIKHGLFKRLTVMLIEYISAVINLCDGIYDNCGDIPILIHGYDYAIPNGKGYRVLGINMAGPWIEPTLAAKGRLSEETDRKLGEPPAPVPAIVQLVNEYNAILCNVATFFFTEKQRPVYAVDFQNVVQEVGNWRDELHPNRQAAEGLARIISEIIRRFHEGGMSRGQNCISGAEILQEVP